MSDDKKPDDVADGRLVPGGSLASARRPIGVNAFEHYSEQPAVKGDLQDLSETPGWQMVPKPDRKT